MVFRKLLLTALFGAMCFGCESKSPVGPGTVTVTESTSTTSTTSTSTIPPTTTAAFIFSPATPAALQIVSFNAFGSSAAPGRTIVSYSWDFGDGTKKTGQGVTHDFGSEGIYIVTLTVTDSAGATASVSKPIGAGTPVPPVTTTSIPTVAAAHYVANQSDPTIPADLTLFFQQLTSLQSPRASARNGLATLRGLVATAVGDNRYSVQGTYITLNRRTGTIQGEFLGQLTPAPVGIFTGTLTANMPGCAATRAYAGPLTPASLQWTGGALLSNTCSTNPLEFSSLSLVKTDAPPSAPTTTTIATTTTIPAGADLALAKTVSNATPGVGSTITFTITVTNNGPATATGVAVTDLLPAGLTLVSATPSQGSYTSATGLWTVGTIAPGAPQTLAMVATVVSPGARSNTATISASDQADPVAGNNTATAIAVTPEQADLALAKTVSNATPNVGSTITFTITVTNNGPATATGVAVTDLLPAGLTFVSAKPSQGTYNAVTAVWTVGTIAAGAPQTLAIVATVVSPGARSNTATITASDQFDPVTGNNTATVTVTPQQADLALAKTVSNATPPFGSTITFTITLTNNGPATATGVTVTDLVPAALKLGSATPSQGTYDPATGRWNVGTILPGVPQTLVIVGAVSDTMSNTASITTSDQFDPVTVNNTATVTVTPFDPGPR